MNKSISASIFLLFSLAPRCSGFGFGLGSAAAKKTTAIVAKAIAKSTPTVTYEQGGLPGQGGDNGGGSNAPLDSVAGITVKWAYTGEAVYYASPAVGPDGTVYFGTSDSFVPYNKYWLKGQRPPAKPYGLYAYHPDGSLKWKYSDADMPVRGSPAIGPDGTVYIVLERLGATEASTTEELHAVSLNGTQKWKVQVSSWYSEIGLLTPAIGADGTIYIGGTDTTALNPDGTVKWKWAPRYDTSPDWMSLYFGAPALGSDGTLYTVQWSTYGWSSYGGWGQVLIALNPDGSLKWRSGDLGTYPITGSPSIAADGTIYLGIHDNLGLSGNYAGALVAFSSTGSLKWAFAAGDFDVRSAPTIAADGTVYFGTKGDNGYVYAVNPDGTLKWRYATGSDTHCPCGTDVYNSPTIAADGTIYASSEFGYLYAFHPDGSLKWKDNALMPKGGGTNWSSPAIMPDGTLYVGKSYGAFMAVQTDTLGLSATAQWPKFHFDNRNGGKRP